ncbi:hypothetical protein V3M78_06755 [Trueperella pyogenes]|uniref:hypothetical protein n=1 Tax=Trueperella pyogenes TaxID=1661 RepID=UPI00345D6F03
MNSAQYEQGRWLQATKSHDMRTDRAYVNEAQAKIEALNQGNYTPAARRHEPDPLEGLGEENQDEGRREGCV